MFLALVLLFWIVLVFLSIAAFIDAVQEAQEKGRAAKRTVTPRARPTLHAPVRHIPVLHPGH